MRKYVLVLLFLGWLLSACAEAESAYEAPPIPRRSDQLVGGGDDSLRVDVWERSEAISPDESQEISVAISVRGRPMPGVSCLLSLTLPDGSPRTYSLSPTNGDGESSLRLEPIAAPSGALVLYRVCVINQDNAPPCVDEHFLVWK